MTVRRSLSWTFPATLPAGAAEAARPGRAVLEGALLAAALILFVAGIAPALTDTGAPLGWDASVHLRDSLVYERILRNPSALTPGIFREIVAGSEEHPLLTPSGYYPPLVPAVSAVLYTAAGRSYGVAMATQILFVALLVFGTWGLGTRLLGAPAGLLAALWLLAAPGIRIEAAAYMLDVPLAAMVVLALWALLATGEFAHRGRSLLFGALAGAGMLTKWSFFLFLAAPVLVVAIRGWNSPPPEGVSRRRRAGNALLALAACAAVMAPYYAPILPILVEKTVIHAGGAADGFTGTISLASARYHLEALPRKLFGWPLTLAVLAGACLFGWRRPGRRPAGVLLAVFAAAAYGTFTFAVGNKQSRYLLPWLPVLTMAAAAGVADLAAKGAGGPRRLRLAAAGFLAVLPAAGLAGEWRAHGREDWRIDAIAQRLSADLAMREEPEGRAWRLGVIPDVREVNGPVVSYYVSRRDLPVTVVQLVNRMKRHVEIEVGLDPFHRGDFYETFDEYDYLVDKTGASAVPPWEPVVPAMQAYLAARRGEFEEILSLEEPDGSVVTLYRRERT
jgi:hypothetical protein